jgi:GTP-binding protein YchF
MANISIGIIGMPNVGKSTLFRALTAIAVPAENYPFCTIDPNVGVVQVPDERLDRLVEMLPPRPGVAPVVEFVDIAGLAKGASRGEGLGNKFLHHVREADALAHVVRAFESEGVARAVASVDPVEDLDIVDMELALSDLEVVLRRQEKVAREARSGDKAAAREEAVLGRLAARLDRGEPARSEALNDEERALIRPLNLLTQKPVLYVVNVDEDGLGGSADEVRVRAAIAERDPDAECMVICAELEAEIAELPVEERDEYLADRLSTARPRDLLHDRRGGSAGLDRAGRSFRTGGGRESAYGLRARVHPGRDGALRRLRAGRIHQGRKGTGLAALRGQGLCRAGRRHTLLPHGHVNPEDGQNVLETTSTGPSYGSWNERRNRAQRIPGATATGAGAPGGLLEPAGAGRGRL